MEQDLFFLMSRRSGMMLEQSEDGSIQAREARPNDTRQLWHRIPVDRGFFAYRNLATGNVLDHWYANEGAGNVVATNGDIDHPNHQWREDTIEYVFFALINRVSGRRVDHFDRLEIRATGGEFANIFQQWCLIYPHQDRDEADEIVAFKNISSGMVLKHNGNIQALDDSINMATHQWRRQAIQGSAYFTYTNIASGMMLLHDNRRGITAFRGDPGNEAYQWRELDLGNGLVTLKNRATGCVLEHYKGHSIEAPDITMNTTKVWRKIVNLPLIPNPPIPDPVRHDVPLWRILPQDVTYHVPQPIAQGGFGDVFRAKWVHCEVVVKQLVINGGREGREMRSFLREVDLWSRLQHSNIVQFYGANDRVDPYFIVSAFASNGTLNEYLLRMREDERTVVWQKLLQVAAGLKYIHQRGIVHGDLRGDNIVVDASGTAKLTDFGLSFLAEGSRCTVLSMGMRGTLGAMQWRAPEYAKGTVNRPTYKSDIYSLGMTIIEAVRGGNPWGVVFDQSEIRQQLINGNVMAEQPAAMTDAQWDLVKRMIAVKRSGRPDMDDVLQQLEIFATDEMNPRR